jgi:hypothetical protein
LGPDQPYHFDDPSTPARDAGALFVRTLANALDIMQLSSSMTENLPRRKTVGGPSVTPAQYLQRHLCPVLLQLKHDQYSSQPKQTQGRSFFGYLRARDAEAGRAGIPPYPAGGYPPLREVQNLEIVD